MTGLPTLREAIGDRLRRPRRWRLLERMPRDAVCAEIGVYRGDFSREILRHAKPKMLHLIDGWWEVQGDSYLHPWYSCVGNADTRAAYHQVETIVHEYPECRIHIGDDLEILPTFPDGYFDWVYLDSSHEYEHTRRELELLADKVNGPITGHDWYPDPAAEHHGVYRAVTELCERDGWQITWLDDFAQWAIERS